MSSPRIYNSIARIGSLYDFVSWLIGYRRAVDSFVKRIPVPTDQAIKVLDAGCGTGPYTLSVLKRFPNAEVYAFDVNSGLVERLRSKLHGNARVHTFVADLKDSLQEVGEKDFDLVMTAGVLEYLPLEPSVSKLSSFLKSGGYFVNSPLKNNPLGRLVGRLYGCMPYYAEANIAAFTKAGLTLTERYIPGIFNFKEFLVAQKTFQAEASY